MPVHQGALDGLCGPYAIINAFEEAGLVGQEDAIFQTACNAISAKRWPSLLWEGTTFGDLRRMISACLDLPVNNVKLTARYPFVRSPPRTSQDYWKRFDEEFSDLNVVCAIVGISQPSDHWIVASHDGGRIIFTDSDAKQEYKRKNRANLFAGERRQRPNQWLIDRREIAIFSYGS